MTEATTAPRFSFLTTAYLTEAYLPSTVESVRAQTSPDWELVVVDNGNSESIAAIVERYSALDRRIRLIRQENRGYRGGVMAAAEAARGEYLCVLDSDDQLLPDFCARVGEMIDQVPTVGAVGVDAFRFDEPEHVDLPVGYMRSIGVRTAADPAHRLAVADVLGGRVPYYTAAFRRDAWDAVGGYEPGIDDVDESVIIWLRLAAGYDVRLLPDRLARYRLRTDSLSRDPAKVEKFEAELMRSFTAGVGADASEEDLAALQETLRNLRYHQALRRARYALLHNDIDTARRSAREAYGERRTPRAWLVRAVVTGTPWLARRLHPAKQYVSGLIEHTSGRLLARTRRRTVATERQAG